MFRISRVIIWFSILAVFFLILLITQGEPYIRSDGYCYYHPAKTLIQTGNFAAEVKPEYFEYMWYNSEEFNGKYVTVCSPGTSLFLTPGLLIANLIDSGKDIGNDYFIAYNGHTIEEGFSILLTASIVSFLTILISFKTLRNWGLGDKSSFLFSVCGYLSSYSVLYVFLLPSFSHTYEAFVISLIFYILSFKSRFASRRMIFLGLLVGMLVLIRPIFAVIIPYIFIVVVLSKNIKNSNIVKSNEGILSYVQLLKIKRLLYFAIGGLAPLLIYLVYNYQSYGTLVTSGYSTIRGEGFTSDPQLLNFIFSPDKGWVVFTPIALLGIIGLLYKFKKHWEVKLIGLGTTLSVAVIYSYWQSWEGGGSFGSRFMIFAFPIVSLGLGYFYNELKGIELKRNIYQKIFIALILILTLYSSVITVMYRFTKVPGIYYSPIDMFSFQADVIRNSSSIPNYLSNQFNNLQGGSGLLILLSGFQNNVLTVQESNEAVHLKIYSPNVKQRRGIPENLKIYAKDLTTKESYLGVLTLDSKKDFEKKLTKSELYEYLKLEKLDEDVVLPISDYEGVKIFNSTIELYVYKRDNVQIRGDLVDWNPLEENVFVI